MSELKAIVNKIASSGKGILAADESNGTMTKRLEGVKIKSTAENRLNFRNTLFTSNAMKTCIGGVILYDETIRQENNSQKIPNIISQSGAVPGIKVDTGAKVMANSSQEKITEGLDGLRERLKDYYSLGARFTKWRGVFTISEEHPSKLSISSNVHALARYAALVQEAGMVPIIEPEVLMDGNHSVEVCFNKTSEVIKKCYEELILFKIDLEGTILKPNMILPGADSDQKISSGEIAELTLKCLKENVPSEVSVIAFLSGGQTEIQATKNLNEINKINQTNFIFTYSYGRALQQSALKHWSKNIKDKTGTQEIFNHRAEMCSKASKGEWSETLEKS